MIPIRKLAAPALAAAAAALAFAAAPAASAAPLAPPGDCSLSSLTPHSYVSPIHGGQALNAINWGGSGHASTACTGAVTNDNIKTWRYGGAGVASDFIAVPVGGTVVGTSCSSVAGNITPGPSGCVQLEYAPAGHQSGLCISTVLDQQGAFTRLRPCAGLGSSGIGSVANQWQDFAFVSEGDGFFQIEAVLEPAKYSLNIAGFGGNGTQVISWTPLTADACSDNSAATPCSENEVFEVIAAA